jgi:hypothetical protein
MNPLGGDEHLADVGGAVIGSAEGDLEAELEVGVVELLAIRRMRAVQHGRVLTVGAALQSQDHAGVV